MSHHPWITRLAALLIACACTSAAAQAWPSKPIRMVVPYPAGGSTDLNGRMLALHLTTQLGVPIVVENVSGVGGVVGSDQVRRSPPDGYTLVIGSSASHSVNMVALKTNPYDPVTDFAPVMLLSKYANAAYVSAASPIKTLADLEAASKRDAGIAYATAGPGSSSFLSGELLRWRANLKMTPVHYKGIGPAMQDVMAGHVPVGFGDVVALAPHVASGKLRILAVTSIKRVGTLPDIPAVAETYPGFESVAWQAVFAPKGTPDAVLRKVHGELTRAMQTPAIRGKLESSGAEVVASSPEALTVFMRADIARWRELVQNLKIVFE